MSEHTVNTSDIIKRGRNNKTFVPVPEWAPEDTENPDEYGIYIRPIPASIAMQLFDLVGSEDEKMPKTDDQIKAFRLLFQNCVVDGNGKKLFADKKTLDEVFEVTEIDVITRIFNVAFNQVQETPSVEDQAKN